MVRLFCLKSHSLLKGPSHSPDHKTHREKYTNSLVFLFPYSKTLNLAGLNRIWLAMAMDGVLLIQIPILLARIYTFGPRLSHSLLYLYRLQTVSLASRLVDAHNTLLLYLFLSFLLFSYYRLRLENQYSPNNKPY